MPIDYYEDLFNALRENLKETGSVLTLRSKLESCTQGQTETVQNFYLRFRQITNKLNYCIQGEHTNPVERRLSIKIEETENIRRYLLNLKREIGIHLITAKPNTMSEAQQMALEFQMRLKELQPTRIENPASKSTPRFMPKPQIFRPQENTSSQQTRPLNQNMSLQDRSKMTCYKCGKIRHFASQCQSKPQGFQSGLSRKRPPQPVRNIQEANELTDSTEMTSEEIKEQLTYEEQAEFQLYPGNCNPSIESEEQESTDYSWTVELQ